MVYPAACEELRRRRQLFLVGLSLTTLHPPGFCLWLTFGGTRPSSKTSRKTRSVAFSPRHVRARSARSAASAELEQPAECRATAFSASARPRNWKPWCSSAVKPAGGENPRSVTPVQWWVEGKQTHFLTLITFRNRQNDPSKRAYMAKGPIDLGCSNDPCKSCV